jgi:Flp pilus assembly pilin Flp
LTQVFIIDNGATMVEHWPIVVFVAETLVKKAAGLDKSGVDVVFTVEGNKHNQCRLKGDAGRQQFRKALDGAEPDYSDKIELQTDMHKTLDDVVTNWRGNNRPATTLIVLTDGVWKKTMQNLVNHTILNLAEEVTNNKNLGPRPFGMQFIRFGETSFQKLWELDNELCAKRGFRDIVDHCSWRSTVEKMFKGSITAQHDQHDPEELSIIYKYPELVALFRHFNEDAYTGELNMQTGLHPPTAAHLSLIRSSSQNSNSDTRWRNSAPLERRETRNRQRWQSPSERPFSA